MALEQAGHRTTASTVQFRQPFRLGSDPRELPPGTYSIHVREDVFQGIGDPVMVVVAIDIVVERNGVTTTRIVTPEDLRVALARDACRLNHQGRQQ